MATLICVRRLRRYEGQLVTFPTTTIPINVDGYVTAEDGSSSGGPKEDGVFFQTYLTKEDIFSIKFFLSAYFWLTEFPPHLWIFGTTHIDGVLRRVIVILEKENVCDPLEWSLIDSYCWRETIHFHPLAPLSLARGAVPYRPTALDAKSPNFYPDTL